MKAQKDKASESDKTSESDKASGSDETSGSEKSVELKRDVRIRKDRECGKRQSSRSEKITRDGKDRFPTIISEISAADKPSAGYCEGQDEAVMEFVQGCFRGEVFHILEKKKKTCGSVFICRDPPGVGKTLLAETGAEYLGKKDDCI